MSPLGDPTGFPFCSGTYEKSGGFRWRGQYPVHLRIAQPHMSSHIDPERIGHLVSQDLIDALKKVWPLRRPLAHESEREIFLASGRQEVIEFLQMQHDATIEQAMEPR